MTTNKSTNKIMETCFLAFIDVLGTKNLVNKWQKHIELVEEIINAIKVNSKVTEADKKRTSKDGDLEIRGFYFSDSFAFIMKKKPQNLPHLFLIIRYLQDRFWESEFCFRGAVVIGDMYFPKRNENVLIGKGMSDAYKIESEIAVYPRIVVANNLYKHIKKEEIKGYPFLNDKKMRLTEGIKKDKDGVYFLDLLSPKVLRKEGEEIKQNTNMFSITWMDDSKTNYSYILEKVKNTIVNNIDSNDTKVKQKYEWLKSYLEENKRDFENG